MTAPRFLSRHVHQTLADHIATALQALGWGNAALPSSDPVNTPVNFGGTACTYLLFQPEEAGKSVVANTVAITLGEEPPAIHEELGSDRGSLDFPLFVDVYGEHAQITDSILDDVRYSILDDIVIPVKDFTAGAPGVDTTLTIEIDRESIRKRHPDAALGSDGSDTLKRNWRVLVATAHVDNLWT